jgi:hypothetical protein
MCSSLYLTFFPNSLFRRYRVKGDLGAHTTTSLTIAHAITHGGLDPQDLPMWRTIFQRTFHKSIAVQLGDERENIWFVDARGDDSEPGTSRFTPVDRGRRGPIQSWELT